MSKGWRNAMTAYLLRAARLRVTRTEGWMETGGEKGGQLENTPSGFVDNKSTPIQ